jgi:hyperosmotically inducible protein
MRRVLNLLILSVALVALTAGSTFAQTSAMAQTDLQKKVFKEIISLPYYGVFDNIKFKTDGDTVTLLGEVMYPTTKESAENVVEDISGVKKVVNNIQVLPLSRFDDTIRYRTWRSIASKGSLYRYLIGANPSMRIIVNDGRITLEGFVDSQGDANLAYIAAREVPGTFAVENDLQIVREPR